MTPASQIDVQVVSADGTATWLRPVSVSRLPGADPVSQTITWRLELPAQAASGWVPGQQIRVRFASGQAQRLIVPDTAVLHRGELTAVYVANTAGFALRAVRLGAHYGAGWEVLAGVSAQDRVALDPIKAGLNGAQALPNSAKGVLQ